MENLMGGGARRSYAATFPPDRFHCLLDELPLHLVPRSVTKTARSESDEPLFLNPACQFTLAGQIPDTCSGLPILLDAFALQGRIAWVTDSGNGMTMPYWLSPRLDAELDGLRAGRRVAASIPEAWRTLLLQAEILVTERNREARGSRWERQRADGVALFRARGYAPLRELIHPFQVAALRRYYRYLIRTGAIQLGDGQSPRRYVAHNEPVAGYFHHQLTRAVSSIVGEAVKPSYVYLASYVSGAELPKHTDREQCEFSVTFCLDFSPEPVLETPWPIRLDTPQGDVTVYQALGDGLAYRGTRVPHYRDVLGADQSSTSIFFHYVAADYNGSLD